MFVEAVGVGQGRAGTVAEVPLAKVRGAVARVAQQARHGGHLGLEKVGHGAVLIDLLRGQVAVHAIAGREHTGHEGRARGAADGAIHVELGEECAGGG